MKAAFLALAMVLLATPALAEPTDITVRVIAQDAKFVGSSMGGVAITLRDVESGTVLAEGVTEGGTGNTPLIMDSAGRSPNRADDSAAHFTATLDVDEPLLVELEAYGPLGHPESAIRITQQRWIIPGGDVTKGGGWIVELPGMVIDPVVEMDGKTVHISAKVAPMCGCPIAPGGIWPAEEYQVTASLWQEGVELAESTLDFVTAPGGYEGTIKLPKKGRYNLVLFARNTRSGNSGMRSLRVARD